jgi:YjbE family integral membrane protein
MGRPTFWLAALQIMGINILLSGDNAVVIALACRGLPPKERFWGMVIGAGVAAVLLILFTGVVATLMELPYLKLVGGLALFWVAINLVAPQAHDDEDTPEAVEDLWRAVRVVVVANIVMSLDNVIAVAAAAGGSVTLLVLGLAISIPLVIFGATLLVNLMDRFPIIITIGGGLIGWVAGEMLVTDLALQSWLSSYGVTYVGEGGHLKPHYGGINLEWLAGAVGVAIVIVVGKWLARRQETAEAAKSTEASS